MSPRSEELMAMAVERVDAARAAAVAGFPSAAVSSAYYGMLYAARAALSEEDRYAKTHRGTWRLFGELLVDTQRFDRELFEQARKTQGTREDADYEAVPAATEQADRIVVLAERFVAAVRDLLSG